MKYYTKPTMVKYLEHITDHIISEPRYGIALGQTIICGSDGYVVKKQDIFKIEKELPWIDISDAIGGDDE